MVQVLHTEFLRRHYPDQVHISLLKIKDIMGIISAFIFGQKHPFIGRIYQIYTIWQQLISRINEGNWQIACFYPCKLTHLHQTITWYEIIRRKNSISDWCFQRHRS
jgi:hypothetical protein